MHIYLQIFVVIVLVVCFVFLPIRSHALAAAKIPRGSVGDASYVFLGFNGRCPRMQTTPDGRLMLVYEIGRQIRVAFSEDEGRRWTDDTLVIDYTNTPCNPANCAPYVDRETGVIYVCFRAPNYNPDGTYTASINYVTSTDNGSTWSEAKNVATATVTSKDKYGGMWEPTIYRTDGRIRIYYCSTEVQQGNGQVYLNANTSYERRDDTFPYVRDQNVQNIVMHELDEQTGEWSGAVCTQDGYSHVPYDIVESKGYHCRDGMQSIGQLPDGSYVMVIESSKYNFASRYGMTRYPMVVDISFSTDGVHFSTPRTIVLPQKEKHLCGAPWVAVLSDGRIAVCYQSNNYVADLSAEKYEATRQVELVVSKKSLSYADKDSISPADFERYLPLDNFNTTVTYNHWNGLYFSNDKLYVLSNHTTNDKTVSRALGTVITVYQTRDIMDIDGDGAVGKADVTAFLDILGKADGECDLDGDGHTSNSDAIALIKRTAGFSH